MKNVTCCAAVAALVVSSGLVAAQGEKTPTTKEVMRKLHKGANSPLAKLKVAMKSDSPDWTSVQNTTKEFVTLGAAMAKNEPTKGEAASFKKLADAYYENSKAMDTAAKDEDKPKTQAALTKVSTSCMACHKAHKPG
jgi:hypothetical protein